jgi:nucleotide-binding universal stress UspA family protein
LAEKLSLYEFGKNIMKRILVAIDLSSQASFVFANALDLARIQASNLMVFHRLDSDPEEETNAFMGIGTLADVDMTGATLRLRRERLENRLKEAQSWLDSYVQQAIAQDVPAESQCQMGEPGILICELAKSWRADLIVLGRRGHRGLSELFLGSVSNYVLHHAPCSVLVIQGPRK